MIFSIFLSFLSLFFFLVKTSTDAEDSMRQGALDKLSESSLGTTYLVINMAVKKLKECCTFVRVLLHSCCSESNSGNFSYVNNF